MNVLRMATAGLVTVVSLAVVSVSMAETSAEAAAKACADAGLVVQSNAMVKAQAEAQLAAAEKSGNVKDIRAARIALKKASQTLAVSEAEKNRICGTEEQNPPSLPGFPVPPRIVNRPPNPTPHGRD